MHSGRGVSVTIVTPQINNWGFFSEYARLESTRSEIDLRFYQGRMSHLKAMLIDDQHLIAGSSNFDYLSYRMYQVNGGGDYRSARDCRVSRAGDVSGYGRTPRAFNARRAWQR